jgi:3-methyladenine DNA glycosylase/8-oxoguanine DNA glycosylase
VKDPTVVLRQKETELARVRIEVEALQTVVPLLDDPMEQLPELISAQNLSTNSADRNLADLEVYYPFVKNLRLAGGSAKR